MCISFQLVYLGGKDHGASQVAMSAVLDIVPALLFPFLPAQFAQSRIGSEAVNFQ